MSPVSVKLPGSGTSTGEPMTVRRDCAAAVVVPLRLIFTVAANPFGSLVRAGTVPVASENMLNANVPPGVDAPLGNATAGPSRNTPNDSDVPNLND
jgi:hypothetical protein